MRWTAGSLAALLTVSCSVAPPPATDQMVEEALPETTAIPTEWTAPAGDTGEVDDGWIESFGDEELVALVELVRAKEKVGQISMQDVYLV